MKAKTVFHVLGWAAIAVGGIDLLLGNTDKQVLPDMIANNLTQQVDLILIGLGAVVVIFV